MDSITREDIKIFLKVNYHLYGKKHTLQAASEAVKNKIITLRQVYRVLDKLENDGNLVRKQGSGRPKKMTQLDLLKLKRTVNHKTGQSQRKLAVKNGVSQSTISRNLKPIGVFYRKRTRAPKANKKQRLKQVHGLKELCEGMFSFDDMRDIVVDD